MPTNMSCAVVLSFASQHLGVHLYFHVLFVVCLHEDADVCVSHVTW